MELNIEQERREFESVFKKPDRVQFSPTGVYFINVVFPETPTFKETTFIYKWEGWLTAKRAASAALVAIRTNATHAALCIEPHDFTKG